MALQLNPYGQMGKRDRELAGFVVSHIKSVMTDRFIVYPVRAAEASPYYLLEPWWPVHDRTHSILRRVMMCSAVAAIVLPVLAACAEAMR